ncbi:MAG: hypothetical protein M4579_003590 [Chaenotheca gracillima]|nr:MAG: hypothetical protein M4579_003590 [Chaenotheca gracillima]
MSQRSPQRPADSPAFPPSPSRFVRHQSANTPSTRVQASSSGHRKGPHATATMEDDDSEEPVRSPRKLATKRSATASELDASEDNVTDTKLFVGKDGKRASKSPSKDRPAVRRVKIPSHSTVSDGKSEALLRVFTSDLESVRSMTTCNICFKMLYEPYTLSCGHTCCYVCLRTWFHENRHRKTCPDCRCKITQQPAPAYLIKDIVNVLVNRPELIPDGETVDEHRKWRQEALELVERDKATSSGPNLGLFNGCFALNRTRPRAILDEEDGVTRCPSCQHELEHNRCYRCALLFDDYGSQMSVDSEMGFSDEDDSQIGLSSEEELDHDLELEDHEGPTFDGYDADHAGLVSDGFDVDHEHPPYYWHAPSGPEAPLRSTSGRAPRVGLIRGMGYPGPARGSVRATLREVMRERQGRISISSTSDMQTSEEGEMGTLEEGSDEDEEGSLQGFVVDDESDVSQNQSSSVAAVSTPDISTARSLGTSRNNQNRTSRPRARPVVIESDDEEDEEDFDEGGAVSGGGRRGQSSRSRGNQAPVSVQSSSTDTGDDDEDMDEETERLIRNGWSPLDQGTADETMDEGEDGESSVGFAEPMVIPDDRLRRDASQTPSADLSSPIRQRRRPRVRQQAHFPHGLRRRSSGVSVSNRPHEDGEADDDDSDPATVTLDRDGDINLGRQFDGSRSAVEFDRPFRSRRSGQQGEPRGTASVATITLDSDSASDASIRPPHRRKHRRTRQEEYNPRISMIFAEHQLSLQSPHSEFLDSRHEAFDGHSHSRNPMALASTSSRQRATDHAQSYSHQNAWSNPAFLPTYPASNHEIASEGVNEHPTRPSSAAKPVASSSRSVHRGSSTLARRPSARRLAARDRSRTPTGYRNPFGSNVEPATLFERDLLDTHLHTDGTPALDDLPEIMMSARPYRVGLTTGEATSAAPNPFGPSEMTSSLLAAGMNSAPMVAANPWARHIAPSRPSSRTVREAQSNSTLRPRSSRRGLHRQPSLLNSQTASTVRQEIDLEAVQESSRQLHSQRLGQTRGSRHTLRSRSTTPTPQSQASSTASRGVAPSGLRSSDGRIRGSNHLSEEETRRRGNEVVRQRQAELMRRIASGSAMPRGPISPGNAYAIGGAISEQD